MKKLLLCTGVLFTTVGYAQVGINTDYPKQLFHVDGGADMAENPTEAQAKNDFVVTNDGKVAIGLIDPRYNLEIGDNLNNGSYLSLSQSGTNANGQSSISYFTKRTGNESLTAATGNTSKGWKWMALSDAYQSGSGNPVLANSLFLQSYTNGAKVDNIMVANPNGNIGFGVQAPTTKVHVESGNGVGTGFRLVDGSEADGRILTSDADGNASWELPRVVSRALVTGTGGTVNDLQCVYKTIPGASLTLPQGYWTIYVAGEMRPDGAIDDTGSFGSPYFDVTLNNVTGVTFLDGQVRKVPFVRLLNENEYGVSYRVYVQSAPVTFGLNTSACNVTGPLADNEVTSFTALDN